jgi:hypothetical protein
MILSAAVIGVHVLHVTPWTVFRERLRTAFNDGIACLSAAQPEKFMRPALFSVKSCGLKALRLPAFLKTQSQTAHRQRG